MADPTYFRKRGLRSKSIYVRITEEEDALLDEVATKTGMNRADIVRTSLNHWLQHGSESDKVKGITKRFSSR